MSTPRNPVGWFEIYVQDMPRAKAFYEATFQIQLAELPAPEQAMGIEMWAFPPMMQPEKPGAAGTLCKMQDKDSGIGGTLVYFSCADCGVEAARAAQSGGSIHQEKTTLGEYGFMALVRDTEGNLIGLHSME